MKKVTVIAILALFIFSAKFSFSQSVGINTATPTTSAALEITSATGINQGILLPRFNLLSTDPEQSAIPSPAVGLLVYNTQIDIPKGLVPGFYFYNGARWQELISNDRIYGFAAYGEMFEAKGFNAGTNYPLTLGVWSPWTSADTGLCANVTPQINGGTDYLIANEPGAYQVTLSVSYQGDNSMQVSVQAFIFREGGTPEVIPIPKIQMHNKLASNGDLISGAASGVVNLISGDKVYVQFKCENATKNIQVEILNLTMAKVSD